MRATHLDESAAPGLVRLLKGEGPRATMRRLDLRENLALANAREQVMRVGDAAEGLRATREGGARFDVC